MNLETANKRWTGPVIVAASGPSLTLDVAELCRGERVVAVNDAYRLLPWAEICYGCDAEWWRVHNGCPDFRGEKWTSHSLRPMNDKRQIADRYDLHVIAGEESDGFSFDPAIIHYGRNSGFQAVNLALLFGANPVILAGFDMRRVGDKDHYFGSHPSGLRATLSHHFADWIEQFRIAAPRVPRGIEILNATPESALDCFPMVDLEAVLQGQWAA